MKITVYSSTVCPYCQRLTKFLEDHKIKFTEIDVSTDQKKANEMIEISGQMGVPVTVIDGEVVIGFDEKRLRKVLEL